LQRLNIAETIWQPQLIIQNPNEPLPFDASNVQSLQAIIKESLMNVDQETRPSLLNCVLVTGGTSLLHGFNERLNAELAAMHPSVRVRVQATGNTVERKFGAVSLAFRLHLMLEGFANE